MEKIRYVVLVVVIAGIAVAFKMFSDARESMVGTPGYSTESYESEAKYEARVSSEFTSDTRQEFIDFYEDFYKTEGVDLQEYMTPKMRVALGAHRIGFETASANYSNVADEYFRNNSTEDFLEFSEECRESYDVNLRSYLRPEYASQL